MRHVFQITLLVVCAVVGVATIHRAVAADDAPVSQQQQTQAKPTFRVYPDVIRLTTARDRQSFVAQRTLPSGLTHDITSTTTWEIKDPEIARLESSFVVPLSDGQTELIGTIDG